MTRIIPAILILSLSCIFASVRTQGIPNDEVRGVFILLDEIPVFSANHFMGGTAYAESATSSVLDVVFNAHYPVDIKNFEKDGEYQLNGKVSIDISGLYSFDLHDLVIGKDLKISPDYREKLLASFDRRASGSTVRKHMTSFSANEPYRGKFVIYIYQDDELICEGSKTFKDEDKSTSFEEHLFKIPMWSIPYYEKPKFAVGSSDTVVLKGNILIMTQGAICFLDKLELKRTQRSSFDLYRLSTKSVTDALTASTNQNITISHLTDFYHMRPFARPADLPIPGTDVTD
jgi:hypothetical protein